MLKSMSSISRRLVTSAPARPLSSAAGAYAEGPEHFPHECIDFSLGQPGSALLPLAMVREAARLKFQETDPTFLQYGISAGYPALLNDLAAFLGKHAGVEVPPQSLFITNGVSGALETLTTLFTKPGDSVFVEEPTYFLARKLFLDHGLTIVPVPVTDVGIDVSAVQQYLRSGAPTPKLLYTIPVSQNPCGATLQHAGRLALAQVAQEHGVVVLADEVYQLLSFPGAPACPPPLYNYNPGLSTPTSTAPGGGASLAPRQNIVSLGSFSKVLAPGLRLGWMQAPDWILQRVLNSGQVLSGGGFNPVISGIVHACITSGMLDEHLSFVRKDLSHRCAVLCDALRLHLPMCSFVAPSGGYFVWLRLPDGVPSDLLLAASFPQHKVTFLAGKRTGDALTQYIRLSFSFYEPDLLVEGVKRLADAIEGFGPTLLPEGNRSKL